MLSPVSRDSTRTSTGFSSSPCRAQSLHYKRPRGRVRLGAKGLAFGTPPRKLHLTPGDAFVQDITVTWDEIVQLNS